MEVLNYLKHQLKTVYGTTEGIGYKLRVLCSVCQPTQQPHLHDLEDCLRKDKVSCGKMSMQTFRFKRLFSTEFVEEIKNFQAVQSLIIELGTRKMKEFFLKTTHQTNSSSVVKFLKKEKENGSFASMAYFQGQDKVFSSDADINAFDIEILMTLIRYCCRITYPDDDWEQPDKIDNPELANLIRIQQYKNTKLDRNTSCKIPAKDFDEEWKEVKEILLDLGVPSNDIEDIRLRKGFDKTAIQEIQNFQTIMLLVVGLGTHVMRKYFLRVHNLKEGDVGQFLMSMKSRFTKEARLFRDQKNKMFTPNADINDFDISIMIKIIRFCHCGNPLPDSFWSQPDETLDSELTNFVRIQQYRNTKFAHTASPRMSTKEFDVEWKNLTSIFQGVGVSMEDIDQYKRIRLSI
ncbi:uncharacterized protein LOC117106004 [Anneissia japonica]|uniref:uncharacterized protein LOC117106004 n=1 Tax=Anneissia japonica TaxID=1529436 RepID=UPI001425A63E|nr:uncharacterized protein LOC117106004 [Anneissia japonica]